MNLNAKFQFGAAYVTKEREFNEYQYRFDRDATNFSGDPVAHVSNVWGIENNDGVFVYDAYDPRNNFMVSQTVGAAYLMADMPITAKLRAIAGARVEKNRFVFYQRCG